MRGREISTEKEGKTIYGKDGKPIVGKYGLRGREISSEKEGNIVYGKDGKPLFVKSGLTTSDIISSSKKERKISFDEDRGPLFGKSPIGALKSEYHYSRTNIQETPQKTHHIPSLRKQPLSQSLQHIHSTTFKKTKIQESPIISSLDTAGYKTKEKSKQFRFDGARQITFGESKPKIDYSKYSKSQTYKHKKKKKKSKVDGEHKGQKERDISKSDIDDILSDLRKKHATYDLSELKRETHFGKPGEYETKIGTKFDKSRRFEKKEEKKRKKKERTERKPDERKHERIQKKKKISYGEDGKTLTNISSLPKQAPITQISTSYSSYNLTHIPKDKSILPSKEYQTIDSTKSSYDYSSIDKKPVGKIKTQLHSEMKRYPTTSYLQKSQTKETYQRRQFGFAPDYQQYSLASKTQQSGLDKDTHTYSTYGTAPSQLNTAAHTKKIKHGRLNKSVEGNDDYLYKDKEQFGQTELLKDSDKNKYITIQKASSLPKKPIISAKHGYQRYTPTKKQKYEQYKKTQQKQEGIINKYKSDYPKSYAKTETSYAKKGERPQDKVKIELSEYLKQIPTKSPKDKKSATQKDKLEIYEYYPLSQLSQKNKLVQLNKQKEYSTEAKTSKKDKKTPSKIGEEDIYEYIPSNISEYNIPSYSQIKGKKELYHKRGFSPLTRDEYKKDDILSKRKGLGDILSKHRKISDELGKLRRDHSETKLDKIQKKTPSSYQKDTLDNIYKPGFPFTDKYQLPSPSPSEDKKDSTRAKSIQNNKYGVLISSSPAQRGDNLAFFKLKFLTTKEVCEKFWSQIDSGELSASMFEFNRNSATSSRLSNYLSPEKNRGSKNSLSNENTEYTAKNSPGRKNKYGKVKNYSVDTYLKNLREKRPSNKY